MLDITKYPDGTSYATVPDYGVPNNFTFRINSYEDLWHLNQLVDAWNHRFKREPLIIIPNLLDAQADRRFSDSQSSGLKLVLEFLNRMKARFSIFHPHNAEVVESAMDKVTITDNTKFVMYVLSSISKEYPDILDNSTFTTKEGLHLDARLPNNLILMSSDAGGFKPLMKLCDNLNWEGETFSASKARSWSQEEGSKFVQQIDREDFKGKDILIVDDLCVYGGTFKGLSQLLKSKNCGKLYLAVSHMTVKVLEKDPVTNYLDKVFTTNSKFDRYYTDSVEPYENALGPQPKNLEIIKLFK